MHGRVDLLARVAAGRADVDASVGAELDQPGGHLAAARVVDADEQHLGLLLRDQPLGLSERLEPLAREAVGEHGHEDVDLRLAEQVDRLGDVAGDRLAREGSGELVLQRLRGLLDVLSSDGIEHLGHLLPPCPDRWDRRRARAGNEWRCGEELDTDRLRNTRRRPATGFDEHRYCYWIAERDRPFVEDLGAEAALVRERAQQVPVLGRLDQRHAWLAEARPAQADLADLELGADQVVQRDSSRHQVAAAVGLRDVESPLEAQVLDHLALDQRQLGDLATGKAAFGERPVLAEVAIAFETTSRDRAYLVPELHRISGARRGVDGHDPSPGAHLNAPG